MSPPPSHPVPDADRPVFGAGLSLKAGAAFVALLLLIGSLLLNSLLQLRALGDQLHLVVEHHNRKIDVITQTQVAAHIRTDLLFRMALTEDPFERDVLFLELNRAGFQVGSGRAALRQLGFTPAEQRDFDAQTQLVGRIEAAQERVTDLLNAERFAQARDTLIREAVPVQETFNRQLAQMRHAYQEANQAAQRQAQRTFRRALLITIAFGLAALVLAGLIAWQTLRVIRARTQELHTQMTELEDSHADLHEQATHDALTGLANRRLFYDRLQRAIQHAHRYGGKVGLLYVDLDRFKDINDRHGHHVGDLVLNAVARHLLDCVRRSDSVARLGGDEFVVLLEGVNNREDCMATALKIEHSLARALRIGELLLDVDASIGQALYPDDGVDEDALIRSADAAMYRVKSGYASERQTQLPFA